MHGLLLTEALISFPVPTSAFTTDAPRIPVLAPALMISKRGSSLAQQRCTRIWVAGRWRYRRTLPQPQLAQLHHSSGPIVNITLSLLRTHVSTFLNYHCTMYRIMLLPLSLYNVTYYAAATATAPTTHSLPDPPPLNNICSGTIPGGKPPRAAYVRLLYRAALFGIIRCDCLGLHFEEGGVEGGRQSTFQARCSCSRLRAGRNTTRHKESSHKRRRISVRACHR